MSSFKICILSLLAGLGLVSCGSNNQVNATDSAVAVSPVSAAVAKAARKTLEQHLTVSSELVPYQEIDVYAKESGYVRKLNVDYGSHVKAGDIMAVLEIPEMEQTINADKAAIQAAKEQVNRLTKLAASVQARLVPLEEYYKRLDAVSKQNPGLVVQQEVDDAQGKALTAQADVDAASANIEAARSQEQQAEAKLSRDKVLYDYRNIPAEFDGVVTQRYANYGTLMQAGTSSSTNVLPLVRLAEDDQFRLVIPVEESYVPAIHIGDPVSVEIPSLNRSFSGKVARFSDEVSSSTRTMHTEVQVQNDAARSLKAGMYANATIRLAHRDGALAIPLDALDREGGKTTVDVVGDSNRVEIRPVTTGIETPDSVEIVSGLKEGEMVVVGDRSSLKNGDTVRPQLREPGSDQQ